MNTSPDNSSENAAANHAQIRAPRDHAAIEKWVVTKIAEALEIPPDEIDIRAPYTSYGLDSLNALVLSGDLGIWMNCELSATLFWEHPTIEALANYLAAGTEVSWKSLTAIQAQGSRRPFFCVHAIGGSVLCYGDLARHLGTDQPFYGFQAPLQKESEELEAARQTIEEMASEYVRELRAFQPQGPYLLGGLSFGGIVAYEMARQLHEQEQEIGLLALLDSLCPGHAPDISWRRRLVFHGRRFRRLKWQEKASYVATSVKGKIGAVRSTGSRQVWDITEKAARKLGHKMPHAFQNMHIANDLATRNYVVPRYAGQVTLFRAMDRLGAHEDPYRGWNRVARRVEVYDVSGDHFSLIEEPHVQLLATHLTACLQRAN